MTKKLEGKVAVVTGASQGIGEACAKAMVEAGARVVVIARYLQKLNDAFRGYGDAVIPMAADLLKKTDRANLVKRILERTGKIDIFHANAGLYVGGDLVTNDPDYIEDVITLDFTAVVRSARDVLPHMYERGTGDIVITGSIAGEGYNPYYEGVYGPAKVAVKRFAELTRTQVCKDGIRVASISPGPVETALVADWDPERLKKARAEKAFLSPKEVAEVVMFMLTRPPHMTISDVEMTPTAFNLI